MRLYSDLAIWWPLISPPDDYVDEVLDLLPLLGGPGPPARSLLELGCGGGSVAFHMKRHFTLTLTDISPAMLEVSRRGNPESEHIVGDMTVLRLGREFDCVLVHDAIGYAATPAAARATLQTAAVHCRPGGRVVVVPDHVQETWAPSTEHGGLDGPDGRGLRYLEWSWDPDSDDGKYVTAYAFLLRTPDGETSVAHDRHELGCFPRAEWLAWFSDAGLDARVHHDPWNRDVFAATKRA
jgi:SAM-dependent methyltransferase